MRAQPVRSRFQLSAFSFPLMLCTQCQRDHDDRQCPRPLRPQSRNQISHKNSEVSLLLILLFGTLVVWGSSSVRFDNAWRRIDSEHTYRLQISPRQFFIYKRTICSIKSSLITYIYMHMYLSFVQQETYGRRSIHRRYACEKK